MRPAALLIQGNARHLPLADQSVQCVVSSPPYWGLRDYGLPPLVWDDPGGCEHEWQEEKRVWGGGAQGQTGQRADRTFTAHGDPVIQGQCRRCPAWRGSLGLEPTPELYVHHLVEIFREVRRVLRDDGTIWLNLGDAYTSIGRSGRDESPGVGAKQAMAPIARNLRWKAGGGNNFSWTIPAFGTHLKPKDLIGLPWRVAFALQADGWWLRSAITWCKPACMPESVEDRPTTATEMIFLLTKSARYFYDGLAVREPAADSSLARIAQPTFDDQDGGPKDYGGNRSARKALENFARNPGRNMRNYWIINPEPFLGAHFAVFPSEIARRAILAGTSERGACARCGAPWERIVEKSGGTTGKGWHDHKDDLVVGQRGGTSDHPRAAADGYERDYSVKSLGWHPTCVCGWEDTKPCLVLDPFAGAGTVPLVAKELGRVGVGVELKLDYLQMATKRVRQGQLL